MTLKELRISGHLTQNEASIILGMPIRTYKRYENELSYENKDKYNKVFSILENYIHKEKGVFSIHVQEIKNKFGKILKDYGVEFCILFGDYAMNTETKESSIELLVDSHNELDVLELANDLSAIIGKKVNAYKFVDVMNVKEVLRKMIRNGIKIYES